ncbi:MAG: phytochelatin synthase family protein [Polyangia bacterium]
MDAPPPAAAPRARRRRLVLVVAPLFAVVLCALTVLLALALRRGRESCAPVAAIDRSREYKDPALLQRAWALPVATQYRRGGIDWQKNSSFCGPASVVTLLRSLGQPADQAHILEGTGITTVLGLLPGGLTLDRLAEVVRSRTERRVTVLRGLDRAEFRRHLARTFDPSRRYLVNFHRGPLFGRGGGHHAPLGGYLPDADLVLVLDVNREYGPWLVRADRLYEAVDTVDPIAGKKRGLLLIE